MELLGVWCGKCDHEDLLEEVEERLSGDYMVDIMRGEGLLGEFKPEEMANFANIDAAWLDVPFDAGRKSSIPYQWGSTGFSVNRDVYQGDISSLGIIFNPPAELQGKINVLDSQGAGRHCLQLSQHPNVVARICAWRCQYQRCR